MKPLALLLATASILTACAQTTAPGPVPPHSHPQPPMPIQHDTVGPAIDMCRVDTLAEQRLSMLEEIHGYREAIQASAGSGDRVADTRTQELIAAFETDLDGSYRFANSSCRTYNRCLDENRFDETRCHDTAVLWHESQDRFHDLSLQLATVRERIASGCTSCSTRPATAGERPYSHEHHDDHGDDLLGSVFSTGEHH